MTWTAETNDKYHLDYPLNIVFMFGDFYWGLCWTADVEITRKKKTFRESIFLCEEIKWLMGQNEYPSKGNFHLNWKMVLNKFLLRRNQNSSATFEYYIIIEQNIHHLWEIVLVAQINMILHNGLIDINTASSYTHLCPKEYNITRWEN